MKVLAIGDIIGEVGLKKTREVLPKLKKENNIDFIIANGENSADGMGITEKIYNELISLGVDVITMGNHTWGKKDIFSIIDKDRLIRPANYSKGVLGKGYGIYHCINKKVAVINLIGRVDMAVLSDNPFTCVEEILQEIKRQSRCYNNRFPCRSYS